MRSDDTTKHADTLTMTLFHSALRRDLERAKVLLQDPRRMTSRRQRGLGRHLLWMIGALRWHHEGEDHDLWPLLLERDPDSHAVLERMEAEHHAIDEPLLRFEQTSRGLIAGRTEPSEALAALTALEGPLLDHLAHEEAEGMEIASRVLSQHEWRAFEQRAWTAGYTMSESIRFLAWMSDGVDWQQPVLRRAGLPTMLYWPLMKPLSNIAHVPGLSVWASTPAAHIGSRLTPKHETLDGAAQGLT